MKILHIDEKWSVEYDEDNNCRPVNLYRYGELVEHGGPSVWTNDQTAMFYALLEAREA